MPVPQRLSAVLVVLVVLCSAWSWAAPVEVVQPLEQGLSPMQVRAKARETAFAQAVFQEALGLLPASPGEAQQAKLREYLQAHALQYVTGYQEVSALQEPEALRLALNVEVNQRSLRELLRICGAASTAARPLAFDLRLLSPLTVVESTKLEDLAAMGGLVRTSGVLPEFTLERGTGTLWRGTIRSVSAQISDQAPDPAALWLTLWGRYFAGQSSAASAAGKVLRVSGWFSPDGAAEFDRVLRGIGGVQDVQMLDMELLSSGVAATWRLTVLDSAALDARLKEYLPSRGLTQTLTGD